MTDQTDIDMHMRPETTLSSSLHMHVMARGADIMASHPPRKGSCAHAQPGNSRSGVKGYAPTEDERSTRAVECARSGT